MAAVTDRTSALCRCLNVLTVPNGHAIVPPCSPQTFSARSGPVGRSSWIARRTGVQAPCLVALSAVIRNLAPCDEKRHTPDPGLGRVEHPYFSSTAGISHCIGNGALVGLMYQATYASASLVADGGLVFRGQSTFYHVRHQNLDSAPLTIAVDLSRPSGRPDCRSGPGKISAARVVSDAPGRSRRGAGICS